MDDHFFFTSDQNTTLIDRKLTAYKKLYFATDFDENSMASRMNSGGSIDLNCIKIDPRTGKKFSFNLDIVAATAWYGQEASRELSHGRGRNSVLTWIYM